jgi:hypothetical protein
MSSNIHPVGSSPPLPPDPDKVGKNVPVNQPNSYAQEAVVQRSNRSCKSKMRAFGRAHPHQCESVTTTTMGSVTTTTISTTPSTTTVGTVTTTTMAAPSTTTIGAPATTTIAPPPPPHCPPPRHRC